MEDEVIIEIRIKHKDRDERRSFDEQEYDRLSSRYSGWYIRERMREG